MIAGKSVVERLSVAATVVHRTNPQGWTDFVKAVEEISRDADSHAIGASAEHMQVAQGRARAYRDLLNHLRDARRITEALEENAKR